jgi:hypothetical protein
MKKTRILSLMICMLFSLSFLCAEAGIWFQSNNSLGLGVNLATTFTAPYAEWEDGRTAPSNGHYNYSDYLGQVGSNEITQPVYFTVSCSNERDGQFAMVSPSSNGEAYRKFSLSFVYRQNNNGHSNYTPSSGSAYNTCKNSTEASSLPALPPSATNVRNCSWVDLVLVTDAVSNDEDHLLPANDYTATITITATSYTDDTKTTVGYTQTFTFILSGYYSYEPASFSGDCTLVIEDDNVILPIRNMTTTDFQNIGAIQFRTKTYNYAKQEGDFKIGISAIQGGTVDSASNDFVLRKVGSTSSDNDYNSVPIRVKLVSSGKSVNRDIDSDSTNTLFANAYIYNQSGTQGYGQTAYSAEYDADIEVALASGYDTTKINSLATGEYNCTIYFNIVANI